MKTDTQIKKKYLYLFNTAVIMNICFLAYIDITSHNITKLAGFANLCLMVYLYVWERYVK